MLEAANIYTSQLQTQGSFKMAEEASDDTKHLYFNIPLSNPPTATSVVPCSFSASFDRPLIDNPSEWKCSVLSFQAPLASLPLFTYVNGSHSITLNYNGHDYKQTISVVSYDGLTNNVYTINQYLDALNNALAAAFTALVTFDGTTMFVNPPQMTFNASTSLFTLVNDANRFTLYYPGINQAKIYFSTPVMALFRNMDNIFQSYNSASGKDNQLVLVGRGVSTPPTAQLNPVYGNPAFGLILGSLTAALVAGTTYTNVTIQAMGNQPVAGTVLTITSGGVSFPVQVSVAGGGTSTNIPLNQFVAPIACAASGGTIVTMSAPNQILVTETTPSAVFWMAFTTIQLMSSTLAAKKELIPSSAVAGSAGGQMLGQSVLNDFMLTPNSTRFLSNTYIVFNPNFPRWFDLIGKHCVVCGGC